MSRTISTNTIAPGVVETTERRTRRTCIEASPEGKYLLVGEQEDVIKIGDRIIGTKPAPAVVISHDELVTNPDFKTIAAAITRAIDDKAQAIENEAKEAENEAKEAENVVIED